MTDQFEQNQVIGHRYRIVRRLGSGGMADVYLADDTTLGRQVAVKVLLRRYAGDLQFVERFRREAQAAAQLNHPNIVGVYDWGPVGDTYYIVMEYVQGETLKELIRRKGRLAPGAAVDIQLKLLAAIETAHAANLVHRDIKSGNILLDPSGTVKVTDFGIARAGDSDMTEAGSILGTAQYLAPEQARGEAVDRRSDLYSAGVVLYETLTGAVPFSGDSAVTVALKHVNEFPPEPVELVPDLPYSLNQIVMKALAKDADRRYQTAAEFSADLVSARSGGPLLAAAYDPSLDRTQVVPPTARSGDTATRVMPAAAAAAAADRAAPRPSATKKKSPWRWVLLAAVILLALTGAALAWNLLSGDTSTVPSVVDLSESAAKDKLQAAGFEVKVRDDYSDEVQKGFVVRQAPDADSELAQGETVEIWVCRGAATVSLVDFRGWTAADVAAWLADNGLVGKETSGTSPSVAAGRVYKQDPAAGVTAARGDTVTYWVSKGVPKVEVPDLSGMTAASARTALEAAGLKLGVATQEPSATVPSGQVIGQTPGAGEKVAKGTAVDIVFSSGSSPSPSPTESPSMVVVPSVVNMPQAEAEAALIAAGFLVDPKEKANPAFSPGEVFDQDPAAGTKAAKGTTIRIWVAK